jgi:hypothetical protein
MNPPFFLLQFFGKLASAGLHLGMAVWLDVNRPAPLAARGGVHGVWDAACFERDPT